MAGITPLCFDGLVDRLGGHDNKVVIAEPGGSLASFEFAELRRDVLALADYLSASGIRSGDRVGIAGPQCYRWIVWDLALLSLDAVSVAFPHETAAEDVQALGSRYGLHAVGLPRPLGGDGFVFDDEIHVSDSHHDVGPALPPEAHSLAFSSGTTGKTKVLMTTRNGTEHLLTLYGEAFGVEDGDRVLNFLPFANYQQRMVYYLCFFHGIDYVAVPHASVFSALKTYRPTFVIGPPIFYESLDRMACALGKSAEERERALSGLLGGNIRYLITGMAPIKRSTLELFWSCNQPLFEAFGITEAGMVAWNKPGQVKIGTVGRPAEPGCVELAEDGEVIVCRDALLSCGYLGADEEDVRSTFIAPGRVATGDIAAFDEDGFLTIVGRKKDAIIAPSGEKFHPEPIEAALAGEAGLDVIVLAGGDYQGVGAVVISEAEPDEAGEAAIKNAVLRVNAGLPAHKKVQKLVLTKVVPSVENGLRTKNMKLDRRALDRAFGVALSKPAPFIERVSEL